MNEGLIYTPGELAVLLKLSTTTIYSMLKNNVIPSVRVGKKFLISRPAVDRWLAGEAAQDRQRGCLELAKA